MEAVQASYLSLETLRGVFRQTLGAGLAFVASKVAGQAFVRVASEEAAAGGQGVVPTAAARRITPVRVLQVVLALAVIFGAGSAVLSSKQLTPTPPPARNDTCTPPPHAHAASAKSASIESNASATATEETQRGGGGGDYLPSGAFSWVISRETIWWVVSSGVLLGVLVVRAAWERRDEVARLKRVLNLGNKAVDHLRGRANFQKGQANIARHVVQRILNPRFLS